MSYAQIVDIRSSDENTARKSHAWHVLREAARVLKGRGAVRVTALVALRTP